jgi:hypothetical protein
VEFESSDIVRVVMDCDLGHEWIEFATPLDANALLLRLTEQFGHSRTVTRWNAVPRRKSVGILRGFPKA